MKRPHSVAGIAFALPLALALLPAQNVQAQADAPARRPVTFNRDIAPIVFQSCARCHRAGESAPFPLLTYTDVRAHARQMEVVTRTRFMPPWLPEAQPLEFAGATRLSNREIATIRTWVEDGALEGNPADLPPQPKFAEGWQLGPPDLILNAAKPYELPASGSDMYWNFIFPVPIERTRWVKAVEIRPGDKRFVHHANILVDREQNSRQRETAPGKGFEGMEIKIESETFDPDSHFLFWKPGTVPSVEPEGMALRLDKGTDLVLNVHLQPSGKPETIQPAIGLYFTNQPATKLPMLLQLENDATLDIPAGDKHFAVSDELSLPVDVDLLAIYPHAHYLGKDLQATAVLPNGSTKSLIHIPQWDLNWQAVYRYAEPVFLPKGTTIRMHYVYDNSADNALNPNHPPERVRGGNRAKDEMAHLWLQVLPRNFDPNGDDPRMLLQAALARHDIRNDPADFAAHYNLAAVLQALGRTAEATSEYQTALSIRPEDATANNSLGAILILSGHLDRAINYLQTAVRTSPEYFDAHYNLGNALASVGNFSGAEDQFAAAVRLRPDDADAHANLGTALAELGRITEAREQLERALAINPAHALARENLDQLKNASAH